MHGNNISSSDGLSSFFISSEDVFRVELANGTIWYSKDPSVVFNERVFITLDGNSRTYLVTYVCSAIGCVLSVSPSFLSI